MTSGKTTHSPEQPAVQPALSPYYQSHNREDDLIEVIGDQDQQASRTLSDKLSANGGEIADKVSQSFNRAALSVQQRTRQTVERAQQNARTTAVAAREHPLMTAAVLGGLATAVYAGTRIFQARKPDAIIATDEQRESSGSRRSQSSKQKH